MRWWTAFKSLLFFILVPGILLGALPYNFSQSHPPLADLGALKYLAFLLWPLGTLIIVWCFWDFTGKGRGTPAPVDPPKDLVISGPYRYTRNPMYLSGILLLLGWVAWSPSWPILIELIIFFAVAHLFVIGYEEPNLRRRFGQSYLLYCRSVPRWLPSLP